MNIQNLATRTAAIVLLASASTAWGFDVQMKVTKAEYGVPGAKQMDVTAKVQEIINSDKKAKDYPKTMNALFGGDPTKNLEKMLTLTTSTKFSGVSTPGTEAIKENEMDKFWDFIEKARNSK